MEDLPLESDVTDEILNIIKASFLDTDFDSRYLPVSIQIVKSEVLSTQYEEKKQELLIRGRTVDELSDSYGFVVESKQSAVETLCSVGLCTHDSDYNTLGYNCMGVYLCRHADVCLRHALVKYAGMPSIRLLVCKYVTGRHTTAIPRVASSADFIEPTQGFDCHMSVIPPSKTDSLQNQYDRSQIYVYDINSLLQPSVRPRQVLPYAVVTYSVDGIQPSTADAESSDVISSVTGGDQCDSLPSHLKQIIQQINAKAPSAALGSNVIQSVAATGQRPVTVSMGAAAESGGGGVNKSSTSCEQLPIQVISNTATASGSKSTATSASNTVEQTTDGSIDSNLQRVISQINARLESQEQTRRQSWNDLAMQHVVAAGGGVSVAVTSDRLVPSSMSYAPIYSGAKLVSQAAAAADTTALGLISTGHLPAAATAGSMRQLSVGGYSLPDGIGCLPHGYIGHMSVASVGSAIANSSGGYIGMPAAAASHQLPVAVAQDLLGAASLSSVLSTGQPQLNLSAATAAQYYRNVPGIVEPAALSAAGYDHVSSSGSLLSRFKYVPYASTVGTVNAGAAGAAADLSAVTAGSYYPMSALTPAAATDPNAAAAAAAAAAGYTLINPGAAGASSIKRPMNDVMLYMVDKKPRFY